MEVPVGRSKRSNSPMVHSLRETLHKPDTAAVVSVTLGALMTAQQNLVGLLTAFVFVLYFSWLVKR